ncbi:MULTISPECIES: response regulator transcription factor [Variovorax]|jgi:DNA-binding response OmpR family regulator|uniref:DNA-binding response OmpR family regulator n=1 Tax=Variovorax paradoxus TaxID=34073 RepID=A0AAW8EIS1_VARPD|nr:response regulator transcription factor [Variovorax paradoxus]MBW8715741.1 response regulator transcription factor [Variovorax paradoxus]MBW8891556.1 response regulator transcription factor [Burkholderiales bacterium]MDP9972344.1 DNA-binding response OmpR family regulator [Variovorax paradoxus]
MNRSILIVEDDPRVADFLVRGLKAEGFAVTHARTGPQGLELARRGDLALLILDLMLPGINGLELCQTFRAEGGQTPVLMLTAMSTTEDKVNGLRLGADDYLTKPFDFEELLARIEALLRRGRDLRPRVTTLRVANLVLDRERMRVERAGQPITLTAKELAFLELLMSAPGRVYSRERILANVWGTHEDPLTNIVDVYVRRLRMKIDGDHAVQLLQTVRGLGYRISETAG